MFAGTSGKQFLGARHALNVLKRKERLNIFKIIISIVVHLHSITPFIKRDELKFR